MLLLLQIQLYKYLILGHMYQGLTGFVSEKLTPI